MLQRGGELLASGDFADARRHFYRVVGFDDPAITAAALLGLGEAHYRLDDEAAGGREPGRPSSSCPRRRRPTPRGGTSRRRGSATAT